MKTYCLFLVLIVISQSSFPQNLKDKRKLNKESIESWPQILSDEESVKISNDGHYAFYTINNQPKGKTTLVITTTDGKRKLSFYNVNGAKYFSSNSQHLYFMMGSDTLSSLNLKDFTLNKLGGIDEFKVIGSANNECLIYMQAKTKSLFIKHLRNGKFETFENVKSFWISENSNVITIESEFNKGNAVINKLIWFNIKNGNKHVIQIDDQVSKLIISPDNTKCAFIIEGRNEVFLYSAGNNSAKKIENIIFDNNVYKIGTNELEFNKNGNILFFSLIKTPVEQQKAAIIQVDVWNYKDQYLQSEQLRNLTKNNFSPKIKFNFSFNFTTKMMLQLDKEDDYAPNLFGHSRPNRYLLLNKIKDERDLYNSDYCPRIELVDLERGCRTPIFLKGGVNNSSFYIDKNEKFIVWFDDKKLSWFSYEIEGGKIRNITENIPHKIFDEENAKIGRIGAWGIAGWPLYDSSILLYDEFDIWKVSLDGNKLPVNATKGFGRKFKVTLTLNNAENGDEIPFKNKKLLISGYSSLTKNGGYWDVKLGVDSLVLDNMLPYSITSRKPPLGNYGYATGKIIKAKESENYLVIRETAQESRNVFFSKDLNSFVKISDVNPETEYNWLSVELIRWKMLDGKVSQGLLYKPGNFDPRKKYPLIINYYEKRSDEFHEFIKPEFSPANINIPYFVDNDYLVFIPDIYYVQGHNGEGTFNAVESAAKYFSELPYIDSNKLGLQGHSFGGWQTVYMITHSKRFAAASEASGVVDQVSAYGQLFLKTGSSRQSIYELYGQGSPMGIGTTPWTNPAFYINNSPIFEIGNIMTPLLMMHNKEDNAVPFEQAIELFTGMRRAGKKVWLLQYDGQGHILYGKATEDYHNKMLQFFDFYLKDQPAPIWMTEGVPANLKGIKSGMDLDKSGQQP